VIMKIGRPISWCRSAAAGICIQSVTMHRASQSSPRGSRPSPGTWPWRSPPTMLTQRREIQRVCLERSLRRVNEPVSLSNDRAQDRLLGVRLRAFAECDIDSRAIVPKLIDDEVRIVNIELSWYASCYPLGTTKCVPSPECEICCGRSRKEVGAREKAKSNAF
jgi:hypothetical protein